MTIASGVTEGPAKPSADSSRAISCALDHFEYPVTPNCRVSVNYLPGQGFLTDGFTPCLELGQFETVEGNMRSLHSDLSVRKQGE